MDIDLIKLNTTSRVDFEIEPDMSEYLGEGILGTEGLKVKGYIKDNLTEEYEIHLEITGTIILESAINLQPVLKKIDIVYDDFIENLVEKYKKSANKLDILPIIWENILMEIPMRVVSSDAKPIMEGNGWKLIDDKEPINSPFEKLDELLDRKEV